MKKYSRVYVEITNVCNRSCSFCPGTKRLPRMLNGAELEKILSSLEGVTEHIYFHLMGEPLTHPDLLEFISLARRRGFKPMITTNGTLLNKIGKEIAKSGVYKVNISLHSFERDDELEHKKYLHDCLDFAKYASSEGVLVTLRLWNGGTDADNSRALAGIREYFSEPWEKNNRGYKLSARVFLEEADKFDWPDMEADDLGSSVYCHGLSDHFAILSDGTVVPCCLDREGAAALGNVFSERLSDILSSSRALEIVKGFRERNTKEPLCKRCGYARRF